MESFTDRILGELNTTMTGVAGFCIKVVLAFLIFFIGSKLIKWVRRIVKNGLQKTNADAGVTGFIDSVISVGLDILLVMGILGWVGVQSATIAAVLASAGVAVGLALQGSLSNVAGGVLILVLKPFKTGDYIIEDSHGNEGTVLETGLFYTKLTTVDNKVVVLPNGTLANNSITNVTMNNARKLDLTVSIDYKSDLASAKKIVYKVLTEDDDTIDKDTAEVFVKELGDIGVVIGYRVNIPIEKYWTARYRILENIKLEFDKAEIGMPCRQIIIRSDEEV